MFKQMQLNKRRPQNLVRVCFPCSQFVFKLNTNLERLLIKLAVLTTTVVFLGASAQQGERSQSNTELAIGLVFGCGATVLLVLGGWFVVKKFVLTGSGIGLYR